MGRFHIPAESLRFIGDQASLWIHNHSLLRIRPPNVLGSHPLHPGLGGSSHSTRGRVPRFCPRGVTLQQAPFGRKESLSLGKEAPGGEVVTRAEAQPSSLQTSLPLQALCVQGPVVGPTARGQDPATDVLLRQQQQPVLLQPAQEACSTQHQAPPHAVSVGRENSHNENSNCHHQHHCLTSHRAALRTKVVTSHCQHHASSQEQVCRGAVPIHPVEIEGQKGQANDSGHPGSSKTIFICA
ncbi:hypothetical protein D623_10006471 [Myotis brandtii]|uniref:Uncharacterized protein n=1 Tax=Myotis brandtii TaxID=109478 RepID=S7PG76_MYOBR|nr:hypothetical protein D623_10006471 [Myotis brandtii]